MPTTTRSHPELIVCVGKKCGKAKGHRKLVALAREQSDSATSPCQGICKGPVAALRDGDSIRWYRRVRGKRLASLRKALETGRAPRELRPAEDRRRRDVLRHASRFRPLSGRG